MGERGAGARVARQLTAGQQKKTCMWRMDGSLFANKTEFPVINHAFFFRGTVLPYKKHSLAQDTP